MLVALVVARCFVCPFLHVACFVLFVYHLPKEAWDLDGEEKTDQKKHPVGFDLGGLRWCVVASHFASSDLHLRPGPSPIAKVPSGFRTSLAALSSTAAMAP